MSAESSLSQSMEIAVKHYSSLFNVPSYRTIVFFLVLTCVGGGLLSNAVLFTSLEGIVDGLALGFSLLFTNLILDYSISVLVLRKDPIYDLRRTAALSLFCWFLWFSFIFIGVAFAMTFGLFWWVRLTLLGFSAVLVLRLTVFCSTSSMGNKQLIAASFLQPVSCMVPFLLIWAGMNYPIGPSMFLFFVSSVAIGLISSFSFVFIVNRVGEQVLGLPSLSLFKAFLLNWIVDLNDPFEEVLEKLGEKQNVEVSLIKFGSHKTEAIIAVPSVHPGPFKNVGSSLLPSMLKTTLEKKLNCVVGVPHGLLGHEFDLASQLQNRKVINRIVEFADFEVSEARATPFVKVSNGLATACCQIFGRSAFLSFTLAPKTTEDLPQELGLFVRQLAEKQGLTCSIVVNSHNSLDGKPDVEEALNALKTVATTCLEKVSSLRQLHFEVGAATVIPNEFSLKDGMGPGGITVFVAKVGRQKIAYVIIDGNNMVSELREDILSALNFIGVDDGEVFTTDTHSVNAVILTERGYHPVGEAISHEKLIGYIEEATRAALSNVESVKATCRIVTIADVKVVGEKQLQTLCLLIDRTLQKAKSVILPLFGTSGLLLMLLLMFI